MAGPLPPLFRNVGRDGGEHEQELLDTVAPGGAVYRPVVPHPAQVVHELHQRSDGGVELELVQVFVALADGLVQDALGFAHRRRVGGAVVKLRRVVFHQAPGAVQPAHHAVDAFVAPRAALVPGPDEHQEAADGVSAHLSDHVVGVHHVAAALAHLLVVAAEDDTLVEQAQEGLVDVEHSHVAQRFDEEPAVEQVHHRVLGPAGVLLHRHPVAGHAGLVGPAIVLRSAVAEHVPRRVHEGVHGVGFAAARTPAFRAHRVHEGLVDGQRRFAGGPELGVLGQKHGQVRFGHGLHAALFAINHWDGRAPVALTGNQPVAQAIGDRAVTPASPFHVPGDGLHAFFVGHALVGARVGHEPVADESLAEFAAVPGYGRDHGANGQPVLTSEVIVAVVVSGNAHHRAGAVGGQHVVGHVNRYFFIVQAVASVGADEHAGLVAVGGKPINFRGGPGLVNIGFNLRPAAFRGELGHQGMLRRQHEESYAEYGVDARGEGADLPFLDVVVRDVEPDVHALAASDPVPLHREDLVRPFLQSVEVQQFVGVVGDAEEPLLEIAAGDGCFAPLAFAVEHLFVGEYRLARWAPHHGRFLAVGEAALVQLDEEPLVPAIVLGQAADHFAVPVVDRADGTQLPAHVLHVGHGPFVGMDAPGYGGVFGRQTEGVESDGVQHVVALHPAEPGVSVRRRHGVPVADVQITRRVRVHGHFEPFGARIVVLDMVDPVPFPPLLPLAVNLNRVEAELNLTLGCGHKKSTLNIGGRGRQRRWRPANLRLTALNIAHGIIEELRRVTV